MDQKGTGQGTTDTKTGQGEKKERGKEMEDERRFISEKREKKEKKKNGVLERLRRTGHKGQSCRPQSQIIYWGQEGSINDGN